MIAFEAGASGRESESEELMRAGPQSQGISAPFRTDIRELALSLSALCEDAEGRHP